MDLNRSILDLSAPLNSNYSNLKGNFPFLYPLKMPENLSFSDIFSIEKGHGLKMG